MAASSLAHSLAEKPPASPPQGSSRRNSLSIGPLRLPKWLSRRSASGPIATSAAPGGSGSRPSAPSPAPAPAPSPAASSDGQRWSDGAPTPAPALQPSPIGASTPSTSDASHPRLLVAAGPGRGSAGDSAPLQPQPRSGRRFASRPGPVILPARSATEEGTADRVRFALRRRRRQTEIAASSGTARSRVSTFLLPPLRSTSASSTLTPPPLPPGRTKQDASVNGAFPTRPPTENVPEPCSSFSSSLSTSSSPSSAYRPSTLPVIKNSRALLADPSAPSSDPAPPSSPSSFSSFVSRKHTGSAFYSGTVHSSDNLTSSVSYPASQTLRPALPTPPPHPHFTLSRGPPSENSQAPQLGSAAPKLRRSNRPVSLPNKLPRETAAQILAGPPASASCARRTSQNTRPRPSSLVISTFPFDPFGRQPLTSEPVSAPPTGSATTSFRRKSCTVPTPGPLPIVFDLSSSLSSFLSEEGRIPHTRRHRRQRTADSLSSSASAPTHRPTFPSHSSRSYQLAAEMSASSQARPLVTNKFANRTRDQGMSTEYEDPFNSKSAVGHTQAYQSSTLADDLARLRDPSSADVPSPDLGKLAPAGSGSSYELGESGTEADNEATSFRRRSRIRTSVGITSVSGLTSRTQSVFSAAASNDASDGSSSIESVPLAPLSNAALNRTTSDPQLATTGAENGSKDAELSPVITAYLHKMSAMRKAQKDASIIAAKNNFTRQRRGELLRRTIEILLMGGLANSVVKSSNFSLGAAFLPEVVSTALITCVLVILYPILAVQGSSVPWSQPIRKVVDALHMPSFFDPASLIYGVAIPALVPLLLPVMPSSTILVNLCIGLASLPSWLIPGTTTGPHNYTHWMVSMVPVIMSQGLNRGSLSDTSSIVGLEECSILFPLHTALVGTLQWITKTSLLPTEIHLFSAGLLNLLFMSSSPPMQIIRAVLWPGALTILLFCSRVVELSTTLAKIPRWRLRKTSQASVRRPGIIERIRLTVRKLRYRERCNSVYFNPSQAGYLSSDNGLEFSRTGQVLTHRQRKPSSASIGSSSTNSSGSGRTNGSSSRHGSHRNSSSSNRTNGRARPVTLPASATKFLNLTSVQADRWQWAYAAYVYGVVLLTIFGPVHHCVARFGVDGWEPFGWAIGYIFGNLPSLRFRVTIDSLDWWIPLPPMVENVARQLPKSTMDILSGLSFENPTVGLIESKRLNSIGVSNTRLFITIYAISLIVIGLGFVLTFGSKADVDTRRKVFHGVMVAVFHALPTPAVDPYFCSLALGVMLAVFLLLELARASRLPPFSNMLSSFLAPYIDGRDVRGPVVISHIFLLLGCAVPLWLSLAGIDTTKATSSSSPFASWDLVLPAGRPLSLFAGFVCVGMGDAAASLVGRRIGSIKWPWPGGKSVQGTVAFAIAVFMGLTWAKMWIVAGGWEAIAGTSAAPVWPQLDWMAKTAGVSCAAAMVEAVMSGVNDNLLVPVVLWMWVRAVGL